MRFKEGSGPFGLCTLGECARQIGVSGAAMRAWAKAGVLVPALISGRRWWNPEEIDTAMRNHFGLPLFGDGQPVAKEEDAQDEETDEEDTP